MCEMIELMNSSGCCFLSLLGCFSLIILIIAVLDFFTLQIHDTDEMTHLSLGVTHLVYYGVIVQNHVTSKTTSYVIPLLKMFSK